jgi:hypothetical protein
MYEGLRNYRLLPPNGASKLEAIMSAHYVRLVPPAKNEQHQQIGSQYDLDFTDPIARLKDKAFRRLREILTRILLVS